MKRLRYRGESLIVRLLAAVIAAVPRSLAHFMADFFGGLAAYVYRPGRRVALTNLETALPETSSSERRSLVRQSYQHFARAQADLFWSPRLTPENVREIVDVSDVDRLKRERGDSGFIFCGPHYVGFEWIPVVLGFCGIECTVVTQAFKNSLLDETFNRLREVSGHQTIRREGALLRLFKALQKRRSVMLATDLTIPAQLPSVPVRSFGMLTAMTFAHAFLHKRTGAPIIPTHCETLPRGRYRIVMRPPLEFSPGATHQEIAQACWDLFEPVIRQNPAPWLWMYKHWRYRP
ncbi:MAG: lysophospholipid acyltransferase family protein, partial [Chthoniobacterales bacterium]